MAVHGYRGQSPLFCGFKEIIASYLTVQLELVSNEDLSVNGTGEIASGGGANRTMQA